MGETVAQDRGPAERREEWTIFIVEDDASVAEMLSSAAQAAGFHAEVYANAEEFLGARAAERRGCLLLDVSLPGMSGLELQKELVALGSQLPIILMSGYADTAMAVSAFRAGAVDFIQKPFSTEALLDRVELLLDMRSGHRADRSEAARDRLARITVLETERARLRAPVSEMEDGLASLREHERRLGERVESLHGVTSRLIAEHQEICTTRGLAPAPGEEERERSAAARRLTEVEWQMVELCETLATTRGVASREFETLRRLVRHEVEAVRSELAQLEATPDRLRRAFRERDEEQEASGPEPIGIVKERPSSHPAFDGILAGRAELEARLRSTEGELYDLRRKCESSRRRIAEMECDLRAALTGRERIGQQAEKPGSGSAETGLTADAAPVLQRLEAELELERESRLADAARLDEGLRRLEDRLQAQFDELRHRFEAHGRAHAEQIRRIKAAREERRREMRTPEVARRRVDESERMSAGKAGLDPSGVKADAPEVLRAASRAVPPKDEAADRADADAGAAPSELFIVDDTDFGTAAAKGLVDTGRSATVLRPGPDLAGQLEGLRVDCAAVNLASHAAWCAMRELRRGSDLLRASLFGYVMAAGADTGFWLGSIDFAVLPVGASLVAALKRLASHDHDEEKSRRFLPVMGMGGSTELLGELRAEFKCAGISATLVFDVRQLLDLLPTVRPSVVLLHASPACLHLFPAIAGLKGAALSQDLPLLFLLDEEPGSGEGNFLVSGAHLLLRRGTMRPGDLARHLASRRWSPRVP